MVMRSKQCQTVPNSAKQCSAATVHARLTSKRPKNKPLFLHILGPGYEAVSEADTFLALSLIVEFWVYRAS